MRARLLLGACLLAATPVPAVAADLDAGMDLRLRHEDYANDLWGAADNPDEAVLHLRAMPWAFLSAEPLRLSVQGIAAQARGLKAGPGPADETGLDLLQAATALDLIREGPVEVSLTGGRELLSFGSERLIGRRFGANVPQPFDGGRLALSGPDWCADVLTYQAVATGPGNFNDSPQQGRYVDGVYATLETEWGGVDGYLLFTGADEVLYSQGSGRERRRTAGIRLFGEREGWSWNWEAMVQFGRFADTDIGAWSLASETGYRFADAPLSPRLLLRANIASGDDDPGDGRLGTFNPLFPKANYFGELTPIGPRNMMNLHPGLELELGHGFALSLAAAFSWREDLDDGLYGVPGQLLRPGDPAAGRHIGRQGEVVLGWDRGGVSALASLSAFQPGAFLRDTGPARTIWLVGVELGWSF